MAALNVTPVLTNFGAPLAIVVAVLAVFDPFAAFLFVAASQISPDPPGLPLTLAQLFVVAWVATLPFNGCLRYLGATIGRGMAYALPFIVVWILVGLLNDTFSESLPYAFITGAILCTYIPTARGNYPRLLWMLALGSVLGVLGYWGTAIGLPMEGDVYEHLYRGGERMGSGRADVNFASVVVGFALWTMIALLVPKVWSAQGHHRSRYIIAAGAVIVVCSVPLIGMGARGGLVYLLIGGMGVFLYALNVRVLVGRVLGYAMSGALVLLLLLPLVWPMFLETGPGRMLLATLNYNTEQAAREGSASALAGRMDIWRAYLNIAIDYPLTGAPKGAVVDYGGYGVGVVGTEGVERAGKGAAAHNFLLDIAATRGIPATVLFVLTFFLPMIHLIQRRGLLYAFPFAIAHLMVLLPLMNLSILNWKAYWALHVIVALAAAEARYWRQ